MNIKDIHTGVSEPVGNEGLLGKTSSTGIPARTGANCGKAEDVVACYIGDDGTIIETSDNFTVYNPFGSAIGNSVFITVKRINGNWVIDSEDCS
jgi:hypothetical protein